MPVLRSLARRAKDINDAKISVLLRASAVDSASLAKQRDIAEIRDWGVLILRQSVKVVRRTSPMRSLMCVNCCARKTRPNG